LVVRSIGRDAHIVYLIGLGEVRYDMCIRTVPATGAEAQATLESALGFLVAEDAAAERDVGPMAVSSQGDEKVAR
jgi:hypothetical protein